MLERFIKRLERREWARRQQQAAAEYESVELPALAADAAATSTPEAPRVVCAVHGWAPYVRPGAPLPPASMCPMCIEEAAIRPGGGPPVYLIGPGNGVPVADPYAERWERWQQEHPEGTGTGPQPGSWEEGEALREIELARWDRDAGIDRGGQVVYKSQDGTRYHVAKRRKPRKTARVVMSEAASETFSDGFW